MIDVEKFMKTLLDADVTLFAGVPDSLLKNFCAYVTDFCANRHVIAANEGGAVALASGHYLSTGKLACVYMQNSGEGNAVNPLASLADPDVYSIPMVLLVGWRGEPGVKDEPQHVKQGEITLKQLEILDIPYMILDGGMTDEAFRAAFDGLIAQTREGKCVAVVVRKGALTTGKKPDYSNGYALKREEAAEIILDATGDDVIVSTTGKLSREIYEIRERRLQGHERDFLTVGSMGHASMIALGMATEKTDRHFWCLDGDGAALMHLGALAVIGRRKPENLIHVVISNGAHETVGGMPVCCGELDLPALAKAAGYPRVFSADSAESLRACLRETRAAGELCLVEVKCACGARADLGRPATTPTQNRNALMNWMNGSEEQ